MNMNELTRRLIKLGIPADAYTLQGGLPDARFCLAPGGIWEVYYSESGQKTGLRRFAKEEDACLYMLFKLCGIVAG